MRNTHRNCLSGATIAIAFALPATAIAGGKMAEIEPVVVTPPAPMTQPMTWTGFYGGLGLGYGRGVSSTDISGQESIGILSVQEAASPLRSSVSSSPRVSGIIGSARLGYDVQQGNLVFGGLFEAGLNKISGSAAIDDGGGVSPRLEMSNGGSSSPSASASYSNLMSVAVRGGPLINDGNTLLYGRLGLSRAKLSVDIPWNGGPDASGSSTGTGVNIGFGAEHLLTESISVFAEYNYHDVGTSFSVRPENSFGPDWNVKGKGLHTVNLGLNVRF